MLYKIRAIAFVILLCILLAWVLGAKDYYDHFMDQYDKRPSVTVLFLGNSRTFYNDMPFMIRKMADSANSPKKYEITMYALPGVSFDRLWNDPKVQEMLKHKWDYVVLQGGSADQVTDASNTIFLQYGAGLANAAKAAGSLPVLLVAWRCADTYYPEIKQLGGAERHYALIQWNYYQLAKATGASMVNVGEVWEKLATTYPKPLTVDGNHPTVDGSYLVALMLYRFFSSDDVANVTYLPHGVSAKDAELLKAAALTR